MSLKCFVKVGSINNLSDARYCSGMNVDHVGFLMEENNINSIDITTLREISNWISGVKIVGEFNNSSIKFINSKLNQFSFDFLQVTYPLSIKKIHFDKSKIILNIPSLGNIYFKNFLDSFIENYSEISIINISVLSNLTNTFVNHNLFLSNKKFKLLNGFNHSKSYLKKMIKKKKFYGISLTGNNEIRPGYKDYNDLTEIFKFLEKD